ncbi:hypothetical protein M2326_000292 [Flavobacterium sp. 7A]|nr:hypothetical protein [Flavobacterium sp. 7A]
MNLIKYKSILELLKISGVAYAIHKFLFYILKVDESVFFYKIEILYLLFVTFSIVLFFVVLKVKSTSFDNVGMSFLLATTIKILPCYLILKPILNCNGCDNKIEKINFFLLFGLFLTIETLLTIRILSKKD